MRVCFTLGLAAAAAAVAVAGCANTGLREAQGLSQTFDVQTDYQAAHRRVADYVRVCHETRQHRYGVAYGSHSELGIRDAPNVTEVFKVGERAKILEIIQAGPATPSTSTVTVKVLGEGKWDQAEIDAARQSIQTATPVCRPLD